MPIVNIFFQAGGISINSDYIHFSQVNLAVDFNLKVFDIKNQF